MGDHEERGFAIWAAEVLTELARMNPRRMNPQQVADLRRWVRPCVQYSYDDDLSTADVNVEMAVRRSLRSFVVRAAVAIGFHDWGRLFAADYQSRSDAWLEFAATVENPRRPAEVQTADPSHATIAAPQQGPAAAERGAGDQTNVNAKQLAAHAAVNERTIRKQLESCKAARTDKDGEKWWRYCDVVEQLRNWCSNHRHDRLKNLVWPDLAKQLKKTTPGIKKN